MSGAASEPNTEEYDRSIGGSRKSEDVGSVETGIEVSGERCSVTATVESESVELYLPGERNTVRLRGTDEEVVLFYEGESNSLIIGEEMDLTTPTDTGESLSIQRQDFEIDADGDEDVDLVRQTRDEAYAGTGLFGVDMVTYQSEATEHEWCHYCGRDSGNVIHRHEEKVLSIFGLHFTLKEKSQSDECPHCTTHIDDEETELSEDERRQVYG